MDCQKFSEVSCKVDSTHNLPLPSATTQNPNLVLVPASRGSCATDYAFEPPHPQDNHSAIPPNSHQFSVNPKFWRSGFCAAMGVDFQPQSPLAQRPTAGQSYSGRQKMASLCPGCQRGPQRTGSRHAIEVLREAKSEIETQCES